jgi:glucan phosphorylase
VTLLHRKGYLHQKLGADGSQSESPAEWPVADYVKEQPPRVSLALDGRTVTGWWVEGCIEGVTGWAVGTDGHALHDLPHAPADRSRDAALLYDKLENAVLPLFYYDRGRVIDVMAHCIGLNGSFFNTHRMMQQYVLNAYYR